jgi:hypothetical protein
MEYSASHGIDSETLQDNDFADPILQHAPMRGDRAGGSSALPPRPPQSRVGKEKVDSPMPASMKPDKRPPNTTIKRLQSSSQTRMVDVTKSQGREIVSSMQKLSEVEGMKVDTVGKIAEKQLEYFKIRDQEIASNQRGLVSAVTNLSHAIGLAWQLRNSSAPVTLNTARATDNRNSMAGERNPSRNSIPEWDDAGFGNLLHEAQGVRPSGIDENAKKQTDDDLALTDSHGEKIGTTEDEYMQPAEYVDIAGNNST